MSCVSNGALAGILIFFLLVLPLIALGVILYCKRKKLLQMFQKSKEPNSGSRHGSYVNKRYVSSNGTSSKNIVRTPSIRASPPTIEHIPNTGTGSVVHDIHPLVPTVPDVKYKPVPTQQPLKPSAPPPGRPTGPPSRPKGAVSRPTAPPTDPAVKALLPKSKPTTRSHSFNLPATIENQSGKAPLRPAPPLKRPPSVHETKTPENGIAGARAALKPVPRSRPNFNANNSKNNDWRKGGDRITKDGGMDEEVEEPFIANKPSVPKKPSTPRKPPMLPSRPPLRTQSLRAPSAMQR
ncbi:uncharacterized protein [Diadema antillarum]|uniref:uncharacterized protein n=1 Tax=Diadema antillarum TaxID=105358 RepID=UPI003A8AD92B